jgi:hypothetical protein
LVQDGTSEEPRDALQVSDCEVTENSEHLYYITHMLLSVLRKSLPHPPSQNKRISRFAAEKLETTADPAR